MKSLSGARLLATPWTAAYQAPPSMGFSRQEYWSGVPLPSPRGGSYKGDNTYFIYLSALLSIHPFPINNIVVCFIFIFTYASYSKKICNSCRTGKEKYIVFNVNTENIQIYKKASDTFLALDLSM